MGCKSSKAKKTEPLENVALSVAASKVESVKPVKSERPAKPKQTPKKRVAPVTGIQTDARNGWGGATIGEQRSITPPPQHTQSKPSSRIRGKTWTDEELLCQLRFLDPDTSSNIVRLFDEGNTIPFMCRYRRELIGNRDADEYVKF